MTLRTLIGTILFVDAYIIIYYRLMVRHHYENTTGRRESTFGALFSLPPYAALSPGARRYVHRYWAAIGVLLVCMAILAATSDLSTLFR